MGGTSLPVRVLRWKVADSLYAQVYHGRGEVSHGQTLSLDVAELLVLPVTFK